MIVAIICATAVIAFMVFAKIIVYEVCDIGLAMSAASGVLFLTAIWLLMWR